MKGPAAALLLSGLSAAYSSGKAQRWRATDGFYTVQCSATLGG